jgi:hypothetical protein
MSCLLKLETRVATHWTCISARTARNTLPEASASLAKIISAYSTPYSLAKNDHAIDCNQWEDLRLRVLDEGRLYKMGERLLRITIAQLDHLAWLTVFLVSVRILLSLAYYIIFGWALTPTRSGGTHALGHGVSFLKSNKMRAI